MTAKVVAIIPARSGSKGVPGKNVAPLAGFPLVAFSIAVARLVPAIERVILSTDSREYADIGARYGAEVPFLRPAKLAADNSSDRDFFLHAMAHCRDSEGGVPEYWVHLRPTTPLRDPAVVADAISTLLARPDATSLRSGHPAAESPFKWFQIGEDGFFAGLRPNDPRPEYYNLPRQAFPTVYIPDGYVDLVRTSHVMNSASLHGSRMLGFRSPPCVEVDTIEDFDRLAYQIDRHGSALIDHLKSISRQATHGRT